MTLTPISLRIEYLADHPQHVALLARWHYGAWGAVLHGWSERAAADELATHRQRCAIPTTVLALEGDDPIGSASLLANDHDAIRQYTPWLASVFVREDRRRAGIARALVERVLDDANTLGVEELYLYTYDAADYYRHLGWRLRDRVMLSGLLVDVMATNPGRAP